ncbi:MAG TPA: cation-transporting P-type ATPase, partial [bacterium]|nr:cation-transporting P-type ATPase [bacterium]
NLFQDQGDWQVAGDPTEGALLVLAKKGDRLLNVEGTRVKEFPFDSIRKMMSSVFMTDEGKGLFVLTKGATETLLDLCTHEAVGDETVAFDQDRRERVAAEMLAMAERGLRVLGLAYKQVAEVPDSIHNAESDLVFLGLVGLVDPANEAIRGEIDACHRAGIQVKMLTGDHRTTAQAIGSFLGLATDGEEHVVEGKDFETYEGDNLDSMINQATVFSRVAPETKLRIVEALQKSGHVVAMTGDGVNDGPALMRSDIGIAMGKRGTEVAKQAADMILQDDDFSSIVAAVREGRVIYSNITKFIHYLFACNIGEILIVFLGSLFSRVLPLFPLQILWVNFVTDVFPALALSQEKADEDVMVQPPRPPKEKLLNKGRLITVLWQGLLLTSLCLGVLFWALGRSDKPANYAQTMTFTAMVMMQLGHLFHCRNPKRTVFRQNLASNWYILFAVISSVLLQLIVLYTPLFQEIFRTVPLHASDWEIIFSLVATRVLVNEVVRLVKKRLKVKNA